MISAGIRPQDLAKFERDLDAALVLVEVKLSESFAEITRKAFTMLVVNSPQWSGNFASNWNYAVNSPDYSYSEIAAKGEPDTDRRPFKRGLDPAVTRGLAKLSGASKVSWRDTVYLTNATPRDDGDDSLGEAMLAGQVNLRPVNLIDGRPALIQYTVDFFTKAQA